MSHEPRKLATPIDTIDPNRRRAIAVTGGKGGVGKSMVAASLAAHWAARGARTVALDGDLGMGDLNLLLGVAPPRSVADLLAGTPVEEVLVEAHGVHLLPALNGSFRLANLDRPGRQVLLDAVASLHDRFETLVIDTAAGIGENVVALAGAAAEVVVVATPEPLSLADAYATLKVLAARAGVARAWLLPNRARSPSEAEDMVARLTALVDRFLGVAIEPLPFVPCDPTVSAAAAAGVPVVLHCPDAPASRALRRVAQRLDTLATDDGSEERPWWRRPVSAALASGEVSR